MGSNAPTVLVTGAGGWIARPLVARLRSRGVDVRCSGRDTPDEQLAAAAEAAAVVVHAGSGYSNARSDFIAGGLAQAIAVARGCARTENAVVFLSSAKVYGWAIAGDSPERACDERAPCLGSDNFSAAKRLGEEALLRAAHRCTVLRISNVYGEAQPAKYAIGTMLASAMRQGRIVLDCTGQSRRDFVSLDDVLQVIEAVTLAALAGRTPGQQVFNVAAGRLVSLDDVAQVIADATGASVERLGRPPVSSPQLLNSHVIDAGYIDRFVAPLDGVRRMMAQWKEQAWQPT